MSQRPTIDPGRNIQRSNFPLILGLHTSWGPKRSRCFQDPARLEHMLLCEQKQHHHRQHHNNHKYITNNNYYYHKHHYHHKHHKHHHRRRRRHHHHHHLPFLRS